MSGAYVVRFDYTRPSRFNQTRNDIPGKIPTIHAKTGINTCDKACDFYQSRAFFV